MATTKTRATTERKAALEAASDSGAKRRPRVGTSRAKASPAIDAEASGAGAVASTPPTEHIRVRAYYLSLERNGAGPDPVADWVRAERELDEHRVVGSVPVGAQAPSRRRAARTS